MKQDTVTNVHIKKLLIASLAVSPFWFLHPPSVNIVPSDILLGVAAILLIVQERAKVAFPTRAVLIGIFIFLTMATTSLAWTPTIRGGFLDTVQYVLLFGIYIPVSFTVFRDQETRVFALRALWVMLNLLLVSAVVFISLQLQPVRYLDLWYGNQNQTYWLLTGGVILNLSYMMSEQSGLFTRLLSAVFVLIAVPLILAGQTITAWILLGIGVWVLTMRVVHIRWSSRGLYLFVGITMLSVASALLTVISVVPREIILSETSTGPRIAQYTAAIYTIADAPLIGHGIGSSGSVVPGLKPGLETIHNVILEYLVELGFIGLVGFLLIVCTWFLCVTRSLVQKKSSITLIGVGAAGFLMGYFLITLTQPTPIHRIWWLLYGLTWAEIVDSSSHSGLVSRSCS